MEPVAIVTALALIQYLVIGALVGRARVKGGVQAPAISGDPIFERYFRAHQNTLEQLILLVPSLWIFAHYVSAPVAAGLGLVFIIGRVVYVRAYVMDPPTRGTGFLIGMVPLMVLLIGSVIGPLVAWL